MTTTLNFVQKNVNLKPMNTLGVEAYAHFFAEIQSVEALRALLQDHTYSTMQKFILGEGSNVLFTQDFPGIVIQNRLKGIEVVKEDAESVYVKVGAGENWHEFVMYCIQHQYYGVENLSLIPGTVGAAPIQNIGAYGVELQDVFHEVEALRLADATIETFDKAHCQFGYRDSVFKNKYKDQYIILSLTLRLSKIPTFHLEYGAIKETLAAMHVNEVTIKAVSDAVILIRRSKLPDPKQIGNAGSFFKNPIIPETQFSTLKNAFPDLPSFATNNKDEVKIPAAWLIEQCGFKGKRFGDVGVHEKHALILTNYGKGTGQELYALSKKIQEAVQQQFGVLLNPEVNLI